MYFNSPHLKTVQRLGGVIPGHLGVGCPELSLQGREEGAWWQDWPEPVWQLLPRSLSFLSEITGHSLFSVKWFEGLVPKVGREPGRGDGSLAWWSEDLR